MNSLEIFNKLKWKHLVMSQMWLSRLAESSSEWFMKSVNEVATKIWFNIVRHYDFPQLNS